MDFNDKISILLVDDRPENLFALEAILSSSHYDLVRASSGEEALRWLLRKEFALILLDVQMPGMDGFETARLIKAREKFKSIPIIFVTAISKEAEHIFKGYSVGAVDYMLKPFDPEILKAKVEGFVNIHCTQKGIMLQADLLRKKTEELEEIHKQLSTTILELRRAEAMARVIGETSTDTMVTFNESGAILTVNPAVEGMFQYEETALLETNINTLVPSLHVEGNVNVAVGTLHEVLARRQDGSMFPAELLIGKANLEEKCIFACTIRDITERKEELLALEYQALHDSLTGLPNRALLYKCIEEMIQENQHDDIPFSLCILDLDHFKAINDTLGHQYGDILLKQVGQRLQRICGQEHIIVVRLGGDEFAILIPEVRAEDAVSIVETIQAILEEPFIIEERAFTIKPSIGIANFPDHGQDVHTLLRYADVAMYSAKRNGSGYAIYTVEQEQFNLKRLELMGELQYAIEHNEFMLYYQPKANMKSGHITDVEALIRWQHPQRGILFPNEFIPLAEQMGLIKPLTMWVLEEAICQIRAWKNEGFTISIAVNLSTRNLQDDQLPDQVAVLMNQYEVEPSMLVLEITESFIMANPERAMEVLTRLSGMGVEISIDDFGTGYSSLSYLKNLPVNEIKVDKSFVMNMNKDKSDAIIVRSIINLAYNLGLRVVAEGVENQEMWDILAQLQCDIAQGYFISRPTSATDIKALLSEFHLNTV